VPDGSGGTNVEDRRMIATRIERLACCGLLLVALGLSGCDEQEQDRILRYQKGTYLGKPDTPLSDAVRDDLRQRTRQQGGAN